MKNYYKTLGVPLSATPEELKSAHRKAAMACHPDHGGSKERFLEVQEAWEVLGQEDKRAKYDAERAAWIKGGGWVQCPRCGEANRVKRSGQVCGSCKTTLPGRTLDPLRDQAVDTLVRLTGQVGDQIADLMVDGVDVGFDKLRGSLGLPRGPRMGRGSK